MHRAMLKETVTEQSNNHQKQTCFGESRCFRFFFSLGDEVSMFPKHPRQLVVLEV